MPPDEEKETQRATPVDPLSELAMQALSIHELYLTFVDGGFTADEALTLIAKVIVEGRPKSGDG
jgi:hypothetical protein